MPFLPCISISLFLFPRRASFAENRSGNESRKSSERTPATSALLTFKCEALFRSHTCPRAQACTVDPFPCSLDVDSKHLEAMLMCCRLERGMSHLPAHVSLAYTHWYCSHVASRTLQCSLVLLPYFCKGMQMEVRLIKITGNSWHKMTDLKS